MIFPRAFCIELNRITSTYDAHDLYFSEDSEFYKKKLSFQCPDENCRIKFRAVGVYMEEKSKTIWHFAKYSGTVHLCSIEKPVNSTLNTSQKLSTERAVETHIPVEFLLERNYNPINKSQESSVSKNDEPVTNTYKNIGGSNELKQLYEFKTSNFEALVDSFWGYDVSILKQRDLIIGGKKKKFYYFFKQIQYFKDEDGLVYWGPIKEIKPYGKDFRITFKKAAFENKKPISFSIYIKEELINNYRRRNLFRQNLESIKNMGKKEVSCFFIGVTPQKKLVKTEKTEFEIYDIQIQNLDHIAFEFDN